MSDFEFKIGLHRFPTDDPDMWTIEISSPNYPTVIISVKNNNLIKLTNRTGGTVNPNVRKLISNNALSIITKASKRPLNHYSIQRSRVLPIWFEVQPDLTAGFKGRIIGFKTISDPAVRARAGLYFSRGDRTAYPYFFILEDPTTELILMMAESGLPNIESYADAVYDSMSEEFCNVTNLTPWCDLEIIDKNDGFVRSKMRTVLKRVL